MIVVNKAEVERLMIEKDIRINDLRKSQGMTYTTYVNMLDNKKGTSLRSVIMLCEALHCQPKDILLKVPND